MAGFHLSRRRLIAERLENRQLLASDISLVKDVNTLPNPNPVIDAVSGAMVLGNLEYFINQDAVTGRELWRTDGTPSGTFLLKDIAQGSANSSPYGMTLVGNQVFFAATSNDLGTELWATDGTTAGTRVITDLMPGADSSNPSGFTRLGNSVYFSAFIGGSSNQLFKSDGNSITLVNGLSGNYQPTGFNIDNKLLLNLYDTSSSTVAYDTSTGTKQVLMNGQLTDASPILNHRILIRGYDGGTTLSISDGTASGTTTLGLPDLNVSAIDILGKVGGRWLVLQRNGTGSTLWSFSPSGAFESLVTRGPWESMNASAELNGKVVIGTASGTLISDGTSAGTAPLGIPSTISIDSTYGGSTQYNGVFFVRGFSSSTGQYSVWNINPTTSSVHQVGAEFPSNAFQLVSTADGVYWNASTNTYSIYQSSDGNSYSIVQSDWLSISTLTPLNNQLLFAGVGNDGAGLRKYSSGTLLNVSPLVPIPTSDGLLGGSVVKLGDVHLFQPYNGVRGEWWRTDGTSAGTYRLIDAEFNDNLMQAAGSLLAYAISNGSREVWSSNGTVAGTQHLLTLPGTDLAYWIVAVGNRFIVGGSSGIWLSDGTQTGTVYTVLDGVQFSSPSPALVAGGKAFFTSSGNYVSNGRNEASWSSDGTLAGTIKFNEGLFKRWDVAASEGNSIVFTDGIGDLWRSDDGLVTTQLIVRRQPQDASIRTLGIAGGVVYFSRYNTLNAADVYRVSGNLDRPTFLRTIGTEGPGERFITMAGHMYVAGIVDGRYTVLSDVSSDGSLSEDLLLAPMSASAWRFTAGSSYVLGPNYFDAYGTELGRLDKLSQVGITNRYVPESTAVGSAVGKLRIDWIASQSSPTTYSLVPGTGADDNALFSIGAQGDLIVNGVLDYEQSPIAKIRVRATNSTGTTENGLVIFLADVKDSVDNIQLSATTVLENAALGTTIGNFTSLPSETGLTVSYSVLTVDGNASNLPFTVVGNQLRTASSLDFEVQRSYDVKIRAVDSHGLAGVANFTIGVGNVNENSTAVISLSNDKVAEANSGPLLVGNLSVPASGATWNYALTAGPGDYDNGLFSIVANQLIVNDLVDYETRDNYSVHIAASSSIGGTRSASLTIDILPVDEFPPSYIELIYLQGEIEENTPVGTPVVELRVQDADRGEVYNYSGQISFNSLDGSTTPYFQLVGNQFVVSRPINYENIVPFSGQFFVSATSNFGASVSRSGDTVFLRDVNDAPTVVTPTPNQDALVGDTLSVTLAIADEDAGDALTYTAKLDGASLPSWATLDAYSGVFTFIPNSSNVGNHVVSVTATDLHGASVNELFGVSVRVPVTIAGTAGNDVFTVLPGAANQSTIRRNGQIVFQGNLAATSVLINGGNGNDQLVISGTGGQNTFGVSDSKITMDGGSIRFTNVESREVRGLGGGDIFNVSVPQSLATRNSANTTAGTLLLGGAGADKVVATGVTDNLWTLTGNDIGTLNGVRFQSIRSLVGSDKNDSFTINRGASLSGTIDGGGGNNVINYSGPQSNVDVIVGTSGISVPAIGGISRITSIVSDNPSRSTILSVGGPRVWSIDGDTTQLNNVQFVGFGNLIGADNAQDEFQFNSIGSILYRIDGGRGAARDSIRYASAGSVIVNANSSSASGVSQFSGIENFTSSVYESKFLGPNINLDWTVGANYTTTLSTGMTVTGFRQLVGNSRNDRFLFQPESNGLFTWISDATIDGGAGNDSIQAAGSLTSWTLQQAGAGLFAGFFASNQFTSIENLVARASSNFFNYLSLPSTSTSIWYESVQGNPDPSAQNYFAFSGGSPLPFVVDLQNQAATGIRSLTGINTFAGNGSSSVIKGRNVDSTWQLSGNGSGTVGNIEFNAFSAIIGGALNDVLKINTNGLFVGLVDGGGGENVLDYSQSVAANVDLTSGQASKFPGGIRNFQDVFGSPFDDTLYGNALDNLLVGGPGNDTIDGRAGNDRIFGQAGNDILIGGLGNDLIVGGTGADQLLGGGGSDILIADKINLLSNESVAEFDSVARDRVDQVMSVWTANQTYATRVARLTQGIGSNNSIRLDASTIAADTSVDSITGGDDDDWFLVGGIDTLLDRLAREKLLRV